MAVNAVASKNGENQTGYHAPGGRMGMEFYEIHDPKSIGEEAVFDVSFGAELTTKSYVEYIKTKNPK